MNGTSIKKGRNKRCDRPATQSSYLAPKHTHTYKKWSWKLSISILTHHCIILSTESSKQRLTFLLDRQFFATLRLDLIFMICPKKISAISHSPNLFFLLCTESSKQIWTFLLDRQFFSSLRFDLIFMIGPKKVSTITHSPNLLFPTFEVKIF